MENSFINLLKSVLRPLLATFMHILKIFPIHKHRIVFESYYGKFYNDNPKAVSDALLKSDLEIIWLVRNPEKYHDNRINFVKARSLKSLYYLSTAKVWVDNCRKNSFIRKRKEQIYIQVWHAGITMKFVEKDTEKTLVKSYIDNAINDGMMTNYMISNSLWCTELYKRAFWFNGMIKKFGTPRMDALVNGEIDKKKILEDLAIKNNEKIVLYCPTFRNTHDLSIYNIDYKKLVDCLEQSTGRKWKVLIRLHPNLLEESNKLCNLNSINVTAYPDLYELISVCDMFITDYSSCMFEAGIIGKPVFIYAQDIKEYLRERDLYFNIYNLPFPLSECNDELIHNILSFNYTEYKLKVNAFFKTLDILEDGNASCNVAKLILDVIQNEVSDN